MNNTINNKIKLNFDNKCIGSCEGLIFNMDTRKSYLTGKLESLHIKENKINQIFTNEIVSVNSQSNPFNLSLDDGQIKNIWITNIEKINKKNNCIILKGVNFEAEEAINVCHK